MENKHGILHLDINDVARERIKISDEDKVKHMANGLVSAYSLFKFQNYEIYYFKESSMNKPTGK